MPNYADAVLQQHSQHGSTVHSTTHSQAHSIVSSPSPSPVPAEQSNVPFKPSDLKGLNEDRHSEEDEEMDDAGEGMTSDTPNRRLSSGTAEGRRKQATAIVLLGVIGAEYGHEVEQSRLKTDDTRRKSIIDGFGPGNYTLARSTSKALAYLLLAPPSPGLPLHTSLRRAAIDLIGRGFTVWEPYLDVSKILVGLLDLCSDSEKLIPSMSFGLPLTPVADSCRTSRHAISLIATARPPAFITTLAKEVARHNTMQQNVQHLNISIHQNVLVRARPEILKNMELLIDKMQSDVADLIIESVDIVIHCLDHQQLKTRGLGEIFPAICKFLNVTYCTATRRIAVGAKNGNLAIYELKTPKSQIIPAHGAAVTACCFSPDGKYLATYSAGENKISFWLTASGGLFGLGNAQTRCVRTFNSPPMSDSVRATGPMKMARLIWVANKSVILMFADGSEHRYTV